MLTMTDTLLKSMNKSLIELINSTFTSFSTDLITVGNEPVVKLVKTKGTPSETFIAVNYIRHKALSSKPISSTSGYENDLYVTRYQVPYESVAAIMVIGEMAEEIALALHMRMRFSKNSKSLFLKDNLSLKSVDEITESDIKNDTSDYITRRRFLCTINHIVGFEETAIVTRQVEIVDRDDPNDILIITTQD
jgi:hypothetical protein